MRKKRGRRSAREIASRRSRQTSSNARIWIMVGIAVLALVAVLAFRRGCGEQVAKLYESVSHPGSKDGGVEGGADGAPGR